MLTLLFDGIAYGMLLFVLAVGLAVTMGLMNFVNLAHGAFAMLGGYTTVLLMNTYNVPFLLTLPLAFFASALVGAVLEKTLYCRLYKRSHLDQVLFSIGLVFMSVSIVTYFIGSQQQSMQLPSWLTGRFDLGFMGVGKYRLFIIAMCLLIVVALQSVLAKTRFGSQLRASVDDQTVAEGLGLNVPRIFLLSFAVGSGLAGLGGALGAEMLGMEPIFPLKFMLYFLIVVALGGTTSLTGPLLAAILLGVIDVLGKYYVPKMGSFIIYFVMIIILMLYPQGIFTRKAKK